MQVKSLHSWDLQPTEAVRLQKALAAQIRLEPEIADVRYVAGADVSYNTGSDRFYAGVVVLTFPGLHLVQETVAVDSSPFPYIPGLLSFREAPILLQAFQQLPITPDVILCDGQGIAHPRGIGIASHLGLFLERPTIGCAKSKLYGSYQEQELAETAGSSTPLRAPDQHIIGAVVRTKQGAKPLFVSPGHLIDCTLSVQLVLACCQGYKLPEPTRLAHLFVNRVRRENQEKSSGFVGAIEDVEHEKS